MDVYFVLNSINFVWNDEKARINPANHDGVTFQQERQRARNVNIMKTEALKKRLDRNRPMTTVTIRIPEDVIEDLKKVAPLLGFSGYQPLVRAYIGQGLRNDLERLDGDTVSIFIESLKRHGVSDEVIREALSEVA
jgi:predicted DNA binding CopG/RHH family protein